MSCQHSSRIILHGLRFSLPLLLLFVIARVSQPLSAASPPSINPSDSLTPLVTTFVNSGTTDDALIGVAQGSTAFGDYDNDGDLDLLLTGSDASSTPIAKLYRNDAGTYIDAGSADDALIGVAEGSTAFGDYDNDGDLDLLLTGSDASSTPIAKLYRNDAGTYIDAGTADDTLIGVYISSVAFGDYDNDGDLDLLLTGSDASSTPIAKLYRNDTGTYIDAGTTDDILMGVYFSAIDFGDYDNDSDLDLLITGYNASSTPSATLYRNDGGTYVDAGTADDTLVGVYFSAVAFGDYDNDGDLDLLVTGYNASSTPVVTLYRNDGGTYIDAGTADDALIGVAFGSDAFGDYDNDGDLDILLTGVNPSSITIATLYRNDGGTYVDAGTADDDLTGVIYSSAAFGDYDNDDDLDILLTGYDASSAPRATLYRNDGTPANTRPSTPSGLSALVSMNTVLLSWNVSTDTQTPTNTLTYNLRVGTTPGGGEIVASHTISTTGYRQLVAMGNAQPDTSFTLILRNGTYYWSVQAIDTTFAGSPFATEGSFVINAPFYDESDIGGAALIGVAEGSTAFGDYDNDGDLDVLLTGYDASSTPRATLYRNDGGSYVDADTADDALIGVAQGVAAFGDYDNDGDLDILLTGYDASSTPIAILYHNDTGAFVEAGSADDALVGVYTSSAAFGDYDNDGDLDLLLTGYDASSTPRATLYRNDAGIFIDAGNADDAFMGVYYGSAAFGDYDNDDDLDLLLTGYNISSTPSTTLYRNDTGTFVDAGTADDDLTGVAFSSVTFGDYDSDSDLDILLTGVNPSSTTIATLYRNDGATYIDAGPADNALIGVAQGVAAFGDYDNDGDLDILLTGVNPSSITIATLYRNDGGIYIDAGTADDDLMEVTYSSAAFGDYDNDDDLDILLTGYDASSAPRATLYRNDGTPANTRPSTPSGLSALVSMNTVLLSWNASTDTQTPTNTLTYNLRVGTTPGGSEIVASHTISTTGYRQLVAMGNAQPDTSFTLILRNGTYYWSVQAIDTTFAGSPFATEGSFVINAPFYDESGTADDIFVGVGESSAAFGDYDNDGDLDVLLTGYDASSTPRATLYRNDGGSYVDADTADDALIGVAQGVAAFGDYDNDGDLDILLTGYDASSTPIATLYHNDAGAFVEAGSADDALVGVYTSSAAFGDYDNDGDLDLLLTGYDASSTPRATLYRNDAGIFIDAGSADDAFMGVYYGSAAFGDYDNDDDLDLLLTGYNISSTPSTTLYRNDTGTFVDAGTADDDLTGVAFSSVTFGDYDSDSDLDILLTGFDASSTPRAKLYRNDAGTFVDAGTADDDLTGVTIGSATFGDYDNDGDLDILLTGSDASSASAKLYRNDSGTFVNAGPVADALGGVTYSSAAFGDYDNDGDLDLLITGYDLNSTPSAKIYRNDGSPANVVPSNPSGLSALVTGNGVVLSWNTSTDTQTPTNTLTYNLRVGTTPGGSEIVASHADMGSGYRRVVMMGNGQNGTSFILNDLPYGTYYWSAQAVDTAFAGSGFAPEETFTISLAGPSGTFVDDDYTPITPGWNVTHFNDLALAIATVAAGGVVSVADGNYNESLNLNRDVTVLATGSLSRIIISGNVTITNGTLNLGMGNNRLVVQQNWAHTAGTFSAGNSTVSFEPTSTNQTISGNNTFYSFQKNTIFTNTLTIQAGSVQTFTNALSMRGNPTGRLIVQSSSAGVPWTLIPPSSGAALRRLDMRDSTNAGSELIALQATDLGGNTNLLFLNNSNVLDDPNQGISRWDGWTNVANGGASGGYYITSSTNNQKLTYYPSTNGVTQIEVFVFGGTGQGKIKSTRYPGAINITHNLATLPNGWTVITITSPSPITQLLLTVNGTSPVRIGGFRENGVTIVEENSNKVYTNDWRTANGTDDNSWNGTYHYSAGATASVFHTFTGSRVGLIYRRSASYGTMEVLVDGSPVMTLDQSYPVGSAGLFVWVYNVTPGTHTVEFRRLTGFSGTLTVDGVIVVP